MRTLETDHLIIGAGLAGSALGFLLRRDGARVLNVEIRDIGKKDKLCAGFMNADAVKFLSEVFGKNAIGQIPALGPIPWVWSYKGREVAGHKEFCVVRRKALDDYCLGRLLEAGGLVRDPHDWARSSEASA